MLRYWKRDDETEGIADLMVGLTNVHRTWGFGLCVLHLPNVKGHVWNHKRVQGRQRPRTRQFNADDMGRKAGHRPDLHPARQAAAERLCPTLQPDGPA